MKMFNSKIGDTTELVLLAIVAVVALVGIVLLSAGGITGAAHVTVIPPSGEQGSTESAGSFDTTGAYKLPEDTFCFNSASGSQIRTENCQVVESLVDAQLGGKKLVGDCFVGNSPAPREFNTLVAFCQVGCKIDNDPKIAVNVGTQTPFGFAVTFSDTGIFDFEQNFDIVVKDEFGEIVFQGIAVAPELSLTTNLKPGTYTVLKAATVRCGKGFAQYAMQGTFTLTPNGDIVNKFGDIVFI